MWSNNWISRGCQAALPVSGRRRQVVGALLVCAALVVSATSAASGVKKWIDADGKTHYGERPPVAVSASDVSATLNVADSVNTEQVVLYTTAWCGYCKQARRYLAEKGIAYREYDIEKSTVANRQHKLAGGQGVPLLVVGDRSQSGFSRSGYDRFFSQ